MFPSFIKKDGPIREARFKFNRTERPMAGSMPSSRFPGEPMRRAVLSPSRIFRRRSPAKTWCSAFRLRYSERG